MRRQDKDRGEGMKRKIYQLSLVLFLFALVGCRSGKASYNASTEVNLEEPAKVFSDHLEEAMEPETQSNTPGARLEDTLLAHASYQEISRTEHSITYEVISPDMREIIEADGKKLFDQKAGIQEIINILNQGDYPEMTRTVTVTLDENGVPENSDELIDALYGGLVTYISDRLESWAEEHE